MVLLIDFDDLGDIPGDQGGSQNGAHQDGGERAVTGLT